MDAARIPPLENRGDQLNNRNCESLGLGPHAQGNKDVYDIDKCFTALPHEEMQVQR